MTAGILGAGGAGLPAAVFELDAGLSASYAAGQTWANIVAAPADGSGITAYDVYLGTSSGATAEDPTFNGVAGTNSAAEFWSFDGGDFFTLVGANTTFNSDIHQDDATFTWYAFLQTGSSGASGSYIGTVGVADTGFRIEGQGGSGADLNLEILNAGVAALDKTASGWLATSTKYMLAVSYSDPGAVGFFYKNNGSGRTVSSFTGALSSPAAGAATHKLQICAGGDNNAPIAADTQLWRTGMFNRPLTVAQLDRIYNLYKFKLGL